MMTFCNYTIKEREVFQQKLLLFTQNKKNIVFLNSNNTDTNLIAISDNDKRIEGEWQFGFISYDYKNEIEQLTSNNYDGIGFPDEHFFTPELLFEIDEKRVKVSFNSKEYTEQTVLEMLEEVEKVKLETHNKREEIKMTPRITKQDYLENVEQLKNHIKRGDIYEVNYCQEFYAENVSISPIDLYFRLNKKSPTPLSCFVKYNDRYLISASPERFIKKEGDKIISQPIKGTIKRGGTKEEDEQLKNQLFNDPKERSENVMIVDLVRNDLSKIAQRNSVKVEELCGIYSFPQVHQMISTVVANIDKHKEFDEIINATFPMGSMTGAPKVSAMKLIEKYEATKRGLYAGTVGYIKPKIGRAHV